MRLVKQALQTEKHELQNLLLHEREHRLKDKSNYEETECQMTYRIRELEQALRESRQIHSHLSLQFTSERDLRDRAEVRNVQLAEKCESLKQHVEQLQDQVKNDNNNRRESNLQMDAKDRALANLRT